MFHRKTFAYTVTSIAWTKGWRRFGVLVHADGSLVFSVDGRIAGTITGQFANANQVQVEGYSGGQVPRRRHPRPERDRP